MQGSSPGTGHLAEAPAEEESCREHQVCVNMCHEVPSVDLSPLLWKVCCPMGVLALGSVIILSGATFLRLVYNYVVLFCRVCPVL